MKWDFSGVLGEILLVISGEFLSIKAKISQLCKRKLVFPTSSGGDKLVSRSLKVGNGLIHLGTITVSAIKQ